MRCWGNARRYHVRYGDLCGATIWMRAGSRDDMMIALSLGLCKPALRCRPAIALCHRDRAGQAAGPAMSAMPRRRRLAVKMSPVARGPEGDMVRRNGNGGQPL